VIGLAPWRERLRWRQFKWAVGWSTTFLQCTEAVRHTTLPSEDGIDTPLTRAHCLGGLWLSRQLGRQVSAPTVMVSALELGTSSSTKLPGKCLHSRHAPSDWARDLTYSEQRILCWLLWCSQVWVASKSSLLSPLFPCCLTLITNYLSSSTPSFTKRIPLRGPGVYEGSERKVPMMTSEVLQTAGRVVPAFRGTWVPGGFNRHQFTTHDHSRESMPLPRTIFIFHRSEVADCVWRPVMTHHTKLSCWGCLLWPTSLRQSYDESSEFWGLCGFRGFYAYLVWGSREILCLSGRMGRHWEGCPKMRAGSGSSR